MSSIPKIYHTAFFGDWPWNDLNLRCHASWDKHLVGWQRMHWTRDNIPSEAMKHPWMQRATKALREGKKLTGTDLNFSAFFRHWFLDFYGGILLDNDLELLNEPPLNHDAFVGWQTDRPELISVNCAIMGSTPGHWFNRECLRRVSELPVDCSPTATGPELLTAVLESHGLKKNAKEQTVRGVHVYPKEVLYPWAWFEKPSKELLTERTIAIHWWEGSWAPEHMRRPAEWANF